MPQFSVLPLVMQWNNVHPCLFCAYEQESTYMWLWLWLCGCGDKFLPVVSHYSSDKLVAATQQEAETSGKSLEGSAYTKFVRP